MLYTLQYPKKVNVNTHDVKVEVGVATAVVLQPQNWSLSCNWTEIEVDTKVSDKIKSLINGSSLSAVASRLVKEEASKSNSGIITTEEEIKAYNVVKTILAMSSKFKNSDLDRISFRDLKGFFLILFDDNQKKRICSLIFKENWPIVNEDAVIHVKTISKFSSQLKSRNMEMAQ